MFVISSVSFSDTHTHSLFIFSVSPSHSVCLLPPPHSKEDNTSESVYSDLKQTFFLQKTITIYTIIHVYIFVHMYIYIFIHIYMYV